MFESQRPSPRPEHLRWHYHRIPPGGELRAWIAGRLVGLHVHWSDGSKPCRKKITGGMLKCPMCEAQMRTRWIGYLPVLDHRQRQLVVAVSESIGPGAENLAEWTDVRFVRSAGARDPLRIQVMVGYEASKCPEALKRPGSRDIRPWLIHLWQDGELRAFFQAQVHAEGSSEHNQNSRNNGGVVSSVGSDPAPLVPEVSTNGHSPPPAAHPATTDFAAPATDPAGGGAGGREYTAAELLRRIAAAGLDPEQLGTDAPARNNGKARRKRK
jgi:hypothetical protein